MAFVEDLDPFFDTDGFGETLTINTTDVTGVFLDEYVDVEDTEGTRPAARVKTADIPGGTVHGTDLYRGAKQYKIRNIRSDGTGTTLLILEYQTG